MGRDNLLGLSAVGLLVSGVLLVLVSGYAALVFAAAVVSGAPLVSTLLDLAMPYLPVAGLLLVVAAASAVALVWEAVRRASLPKSDRLAGAAATLERLYPPLASAGLSGMLAPPEPTPEERAERELAALKRRYVAGELTETEFERELERLSTDLPVDRVDVSALDVESDAAADAPVRETDSRR
jgi:hypothetical protein